MSGRPEILWPLFGDLEKLPGIGPKSASNFKHLNVEKPRDLIFTLPSGGIDRRPGQLDHRGHATLRRHRRD